MGRVEPVSLGPRLEVTVGPKVVGPAEDGEGVINGDGAGDEGAAVGNGVGRKLGAGVGGSVSSLLFLSLFLSLFLLALSSLATTDELQRSSAHTHISRKGLVIPMVKV